MELKKKYGGDRALHLASCNGYERVVKALIDRKVDIDAQTQMGWTSLMFAAHEGHLNIVKLLLEKKANATITTYDIVDLEDKYKMQCKTVIEIVEMKNEYIKEKVGDIESAPWSPLESTLLLKLEKENNERVKILELLRNSLN
jgi:ankyrin repeat protein